ncbi:hypothetical protein [Williamsia sterculiae]|uniref:hypothetical protein n=1 Tax=Williamsia sterculiae TaxID=1344003 RepID=UPI00117D6A6C|nr:hypothetical protein [Williamsia sterculiae]
MKTHQKHPTTTTAAEPFQHNIPSREKIPTKKTTKTSIKNSQNNLMPQKNGTKQSINTLSSSQRTHTHPTNTHTGHQQKQAHIIRHTHTSATLPTYHSRLWAATCSLRIHSALSGRPA